MAKEDIKSVQECPRCRKTTLSFDKDFKSFICSSCGYKVVLLS